MAVKQSELQDQFEHFNESHGCHLIPLKRTWAPNQEDASCDTDEQTSKRLRCKGSPMEYQPISPGLHPDFWDRYCDYKYDTNHDVLPEKVAHFLQDDIFQRTRTVWIKQGSQFEGAIGCTRHDPRSNPFAADAEALSTRKQIRTALRQNAGSSVQNFTVPVAQETIDLYLHALDLRWYQQRSGGKAPISQRPSYCEPVKNALEVFRRRLIMDTIKVRLDGARPAPSQLNMDTTTDTNMAAQEPPQPPNDTVAKASSRDRPFSLMEEAEDDYDSGAPTSDDDDDDDDEEEDLEVNLVSPLRQEDPVSPLHQKEWEEEEQDLESMRQMRQESEHLEAQPQVLGEEELQQLLNDLAPEITLNLSCIQGEVSMEDGVPEEEVPLPLELKLCEQELTPEEEEGQEIQLLREVLNVEEPRGPGLALSPISEEEAVSAFNEFLREASSSCMPTPFPLEATGISVNAFESSFGETQQQRVSAFQDVIREESSTCVTPVMREADGVDASESLSSSSEVQSASPTTPPDPERFKVDGKVLTMKDVGLGYLKNQERRGSDPDVSFSVVPEYKGYVGEDDSACELL
ncbi:hypothetical protein CPC16_004049 [Podila verticillata]|nr:hypothetical protein CPC16_004049 [Podila verticillata]